MNIYAQNQSVGIGPAGFGLNRYTEKTKAVFQSQRRRFLGADLQKLGKLPRCEYEIERAVAAAAPRFRRQIRQSVSIMIRSRGIFSMTSCDRRAFL